MAGGYDGSIRIDTLINTLPINSGINRIESKVKALASTIGLVFGAKELISFGKNAVEAASDLTEAQNVVDTAFGEMSYKMEQFADTALETYGISELTAKNMGSTYMAMAKGMGVATDAASDMAVTLTGRLSDIMSFYNKTQSEVDTIGRALITGETEPLKAIGVVMTQTNLAAYAMAQGFTKSYTEMSANEQLLVRYKYFLEQTALAQGDFSKTSENWANQTRMLSERLNEFMTNLGAVIMNVLTPALQFANEAVMFLNDLFFVGKTKEETTAAKNAEAVTDEVTAVGTAAEKSEKKLNSLLSGFDELHIISGAKSNNDESATDVGIGTSDLLGVNLEADASAAKKAAGKYRGIINDIYLAFKRHPLTKLIGDIIKKVGEFFGLFEDDGGIDAGGVVTMLMTVLEAFLAYKSISTITGAISAFSSGFGGLIGIITAHPVTAAVVGVIALAAAIYSLTMKLKKEEISSHFGDIAISFEEINELVGPITEDIDNVAKAFDDNKTRLKTAKDNFTDIAKAVQQTAEAFKNGAVEQDVESFAEQLNGFIDSALEVNDATYDTSALEAVFAADGIIDDEEQKILERYDTFGGTVAERIEGIRSEIQKITQTAIDENRKLLKSELENIQELYDEIARMTQTQEDVKTSATWERLKNGAYTYDSYAELADAIKEAQEQAEKSRQITEQAAYEDVLMKLSGMSSDYSEAEIEAMKAEDFEKIANDMEAMKLKDKRYERDVILAWTRGSFSNMADHISEDPETQKKLRQYFELMLSKPANVDISEFALQLGDVGYIDRVYRILEEMKAQFGLDFEAEWTKLSEEIGDNGGIVVEEYYSNLEAILNDTERIDADSLMPKVEAFKELGGDSGQAYTDAIAGWIAETDYTITIGTELDTLAADEWLSQYTKDKLGYEWVEGVTSSYAQQPNKAAAPAERNYFEFPIYIDNELKGTVEVKSQRTLGGTDFLVTNAKGK